MAQFVKIFSGNVIGRRDLDVDDAAVGAGGGWEVIVSMEVQSIMVTNTTDVALGSLPSLRNYL